VNATDPSITELARLRDALESAAQVIHERGASLQRQLAALDVARTEAEAANRAKDEFLAVLSHELRTPLNAVFGWAQMLRKGQVHGEVAQRALDTIVRNAHVQLQLIDELLDVSRVAMGKMRLQIQPLDPRTVIEQALDAIRPAAEARRITVRADLARGAGVVIGDAARLQQVVWNLLTNAVKFTEPGGRSRWCCGEAARTSRSSCMTRGGASRRSSCRSCSTLPPGRQLQQRRAHSGLGLGLALVKHLVELHGGTVAAHSDGEGKGATFTIRLPVTSAALDGGGQAVPSRRPAATILDAPARATRLDGLRVLVVDDDVDALELTTAVLVNGGAVVRTCGPRRKRFSWSRHGDPTSSSRTSRCPVRTATRSSGKCAPSTVSAAAERRRWP
jgi:K+-sensing histidine kinase KdpD